MPLRRVAERLVDGLLHAVELLVDAVERINHLRQLRVFWQELRGRADGALAGLEDVADVVDDDPGAADQVPRLIGQGLQRLERGAELRHAGRRVLKVDGQTLRHVLRVETEGIEDGVRRGDGVCDRLNDGAVDLLLHGGLGLAGDLGGDGVFLLVFVVLDLRVAQITLENADKVARQIGGHDERGVILAGLNARERFFTRVEELPAHLVVRVQGVDHHVADVELDAENIASLVLARNGDMDVRGGGRAVGVPVREDVEPRIQARHKAQADDDDHRHDARRQAAPVRTEDAENLSHFRPSSPCCHRSSDRPCSAWLSRDRSCATRAMRCGSCMS